MRVILRILASLLDIFVFIGILVALFVFALPFFLEMLYPASETVEMVLVIGVFTAAVVLTALLQYPFLINHQTLGKAMFGLKIRSTNDSRPLTVSIIIQRELFTKVLTMYLLCLPMLFGKKGQHDITCETEVV